MQGIRLRRIALWAERRDGNFVGVFQRSLLYLKKQKGEIMPYKEPDYETVILLKLGAIENSLKSFMSSLKEPLQKEWGRAVIVYAPVSGRISWFFGDDNEVKEGWVICSINYDPARPEKNVPSPATGHLFIHREAEGGELVYGGMPIAHINT